MSVYTNVVFHADPGHNSTFTIRTSQPWLQKL